MPILFPFPGRTDNETYEVNGRTYCMPNHGLVKNRTFAVGEQKQNSVKLWVKDDDAVRNRNYPYHYKLEVLYQIIKETLVIKAIIKNDKNEFLLVNKSEGFTVRCKMDEAYQCIVIYNGTPGSVCVEPWCGFPDAIHANKMVEWIAPGQSREYTLKMELYADVI